MQEFAAADGSECITTGPSNYWACCETKLTNATSLEDASCPPANCTELYPQGV